MEGIVLEKVKVAYACVDEARDYRGNKKYAFDATYLINKRDKKTIEEIQKAIEEAKEKGIRTKWGGFLPDNCAGGLKDGDNPKDNKKDDDRYYGYYFLHAKSENKPQIVDAKNVDIFEKEAIHSGVIVNAHVRFKPYSSGGSDGVSCILGPIMKIAERDLNPQPTILATEVFVDGRFN